jgi:hypothetical protein
VAIGAISGESESERDDGPCQKSEFVRPPRILDTARSGQFWWTRDWGLMASGLDPLLKVGSRSLTLRLSHSVWRVRLLLDVEAPLGPQCLPVRSCLKMISLMGHTPSSDQGSQGCI